MPLESDPVNTPAPVTTAELTATVELAAIAELAAQFNQGAVLQDLAHLRSRLHRDISKFDQVEIQETLQSEYAKFAVLIQRAERLVLRTHARRIQKFGELSNLVCSLHVAITSLGQQKPNLSLARQIRLDVEQEIVRHEHRFPLNRFLINRFLYVWHSPSTPLKVIYGLACAFVIIFGSLFSLAILQFAIHAAGVANAELKDYKSVKTREVALNQELFRQEQVGKQILGIEERKFKQSAQEDPIAAARLSELRKQLGHITEKIDDLQQLQATQKPQRPPAELSPIQKLLANVADVGVSSTLSQILWVAAAGTLGSIVSILIRVIEEFHDKDYRDRLTPFFIGFFKPAIGASFGILFLAFIKSGVVSTPLLIDSKSMANPSSQTVPAASPERQSAFLMFAIAFVVGFSERLAKDTITRLDGTSPKVADPGPASDKPRIVIIRPKQYVAINAVHPKRSESGQHLPARAQDVPSPESSEGGNLSANG
jgi:hypothetical protein